MDAIVAVRVIDGLDEALAHIRRYGSAHTDAIITSDAAAAERFLNELDSAIVMHNASTQFADGGEFGMGAEIGIATGKIHARGPVGAVELTSYKYQVRGSGQTRPSSPREPTSSCLFRRRRSARRPFYDVIVIGAGINGAAIAREAALSGLAVLLVERGDLAAGTSARRRD